LDLNDLGYAAVVSSVGVEAYLWHGGQLTQILPPPESWASVHAINNRNEALGAFTTALKEPPFEISAGFLLRDGTITLFEPFPGDDRAGGARINSTGVVIGISGHYVSDPPNWANQAFIWSDGISYRLSEKVDRVPGFWFASATAISENTWLVAQGIGVQGNPVCALLLPVYSMGDADGNCRTDVDDLLIVINHWGQSGAQGDVTHDGIVNIDDLLLVINHWTTANDARR
jgi:hypothetical protein